MEERFINIKEVQTWMKVREKMDKNISTVNPMHCKECGDTNPKNGFYPLLSSCVVGGVNGTSLLTCNRCRLDDDEYKKIFSEPKEIV